MSVILALAAAATVAILALAISNPFHALVVTLAAKPLIDATWQQSIGGVSLLQATAGLLPLILLPRLLTQRRNEARAEFRFLRSCGILLIAAQLPGIMAIAFNEEPRDSIDAVLRNLNTLLAFLWIPLAATTPRHARILLGATIAGSIFPIITTQLITPGVDQERIRQTSGLIRNIGYYHDAVSVRHFGLQSAFALVTYKLYFARGKAIETFALTAMAAGTAIMVYRGYTRGALTTLLIWGGLLMGSRQLPSRGWRVALGATALAALTIGPALREGSELFRLFEKEIGAYNGTIGDQRFVLNGRAFIWQDRLAAFFSVDDTSRFLFGLGTADAGAGAHNEFLRLLEVSGLVGLAGYLIAHLALVGIAFRKRRELARGGQMTLLTMLATMITLEAIASVPGNMPHYQWFAYGWFGLLITRPEAIAARPQALNAPHPDWHAQPQSPATRKSVQA